MIDLSWRRWESPVVLPIAGLLLGAATGLGTNLVNGRVSTDYYVAVLRLPLKVVTPAIVTHGLVEGGLLGVAFGLTFAVAAVATTRLRAPLRMTLGAVLFAVGIDVACWAIGGVVGLCVGWASPATFHAIAPPSAGFDGAALRRFAWVGETIAGAYVGTPIAAVVGCVTLHRRWQSVVGQQATGRRFPVLVAADVA